MANVRAYNQNTIWASTATTYTTPPATPSQGTAYRFLTDTTHADGYKYLSKAPSDLTNQVLFNLTSALVDLQAHGTIGWRTGTTYVKGAICYGSDNLPYVSLQNSNTGQDPISSPAYWALMPPAAGTITSNYETTIQGIKIKFGKVEQTGKNQNQVYSLNFTDGSLGLTNFNNLFHVFWQISQASGTLETFVQEAGSTATTLRWQYQGVNVPAGFTSFLAIGN